MLVKNKSDLSQCLIHLVSGLLAAILLLPSAYAQSDWGSESVAAKYRPSTAWTKNFSKTPDVVANASIQNAIASCDSVVGQGNYCVVQISDTAYGLPLVINRSKLKLVGKPRMKPLTSAKNGNYITIGSNRQKIVISQLDLKGRKAGDKEIFGIVVKGKNIRDIVIQNNKIHHFSSDENAHGIAVYGTGANDKESIQWVSILGNRIYSMRTGSSESIAVNGNVRSWQIRNNDLYDLNNIAIDAIGGEGTAPSVKVNGRILPGPFDVARYGFIEDNFVENMSTKGNPAYGGVEGWVAAIYVDGGHHIHVANNVVQNAPWAYEVGAENCLVSNNVTMIGNKATGSKFGDLLLGGYRKRGYDLYPAINCNPKNTIDKYEGHGYVSYLTIKQNLFNSQGVTVKVIKPQFRVRHALILEPGVKPKNQYGDGSAPGDQNAIKTSIN